MNHIRNVIVALAAAAALSLVAGCGALDAPAQDISGPGEGTSDTPAPEGPVRTNLHRLDFGDGEAAPPAQPETTRDANLSRLDFNDNGLG
ncbi:hypothetical protein IEZ26_10600 [Nocardioides cavernae]|uniref:Uncharacterized protein n=1 Tax=Nocardioides cavernae TaxID=1921566 RepID=A0ABR8NCW3_9ACTN|nr:hypothetical protein [Nocardioides cavernae]MBD3925071.1 hypothetical protein [Nocardioides cavernae]MBM7514555.1 putative small lipoprotein YifL [Nocardioides cavernae]